MPDDASKFENLTAVYEDREEKDKLQNFFQDVATEDSNRQQHIQNSARWHKKRFGIRPQQVSWPWPNASNLHIPLTDKTMRRAKPNFANLIGSNYPTVILQSNILGDDQNLIRGLERKFHETLFDEEQMNAFLPLCWGIDLMLERGRFVTKVVQEFTPSVWLEEIVIANLPDPLKEFIFSPQTTDSMLALELSMRFNMNQQDKNDQDQLRRAIKQFRNGSEVVRFERKINLTPHPTLVVRDPNTILFPQDTTFFISTARWIRDRVFLTTNDLVARLDSGMWDKANANLLLDRISSANREYGSNRLPSSTAIDMNERTREGISPMKPIGSHVLEEFYYWKRFPGKQLAERVVLTIHPDHQDLPLRLIRFPYVQPNGNPEDWPFDQVMAEVISDRAYAPRGYPQLLDSLQTEITNNHNAKSNNMTIANNLNIKAKRNSGVSTQFIPGQPLWVNRMDDVMELNIQPKDMSFDNEERNLANWAEGYIGLIDQTLTNQTGIPERRTKAEVDAVSSLQAQVASLDVRVYQACMQRVYRRVWNRWMQYGPDDISYMGQDGNPRTISKQDIRNRFKVKTAGNIFTTNRQLQASRAAQRFQVLQGNTLIDQYKLLQNWLSLEDEREAMDLMKTPEQAQQDQIERFIDDINHINNGYTVIPRATDDNKSALSVIQDFLQDPIKRRNFHEDRLPNLQNFMEAHKLALQKKSQATSRGGRAEQEVAAVAQGQTGREARQ